MKIAYLLCLITLFSTPLSHATEPVIIDEILAVLPHQGGDILILASDLLMSMDGTTRTLWEVIRDGLMVLKARDIGINIPESALEGMIAQMQKRYNMTHDQFVELFEAQGYSFTEGKELLKRRKMIDEVMNVLVHVDEPSKDEIERYYVAHPEYEEATYTIRLTFIPLTEFGEAEIQTMISEHKTPDSVIWDEEETYTESALADEQLFVKQMKEGEIRIMNAASDGYDLIQLIKKSDMQHVPLDESRISMQLRQEKFIEALHELEDDLMQKGKIRFCNPEFKRESLVRPQAPATDTKAQKRASRGRSQR